MAAPIQHQNFRPSNPNAMQTSQQGDTQRGGGFQDKPDGFIHSSFQRDIMKAREILTDLLKMAATLLQDNSKQPGNQKDKDRLKLEKRLEELFRVLDQVESNLKLALQWHTQSAESKRHVTLPVPSKKTDELAAAAAHAGQPQKPQAIPLQLYMNVVKHQIQAAQDLHDLITDTESRLTRSASLQSTVAAGNTTAAPKT